MANILVRYQYRSASNDKNEERPAIFSNPSGVPISIIQHSIRRFTLDGREHLEDFGWFVPQEVGLPAMFFGNYDADDDGPLHEILEVEETDLAPNAGSINLFIAALVHGAGTGWNKVADLWHDRNLLELG